MNDGNLSKFILYLLILIFPMILWAQEEKPLSALQEYISRDRTTTYRSLNTSNYDVKYHRLEIEVDPAVYYIRANVTTYFTPTTQPFDKIYFDFRDNMVIDSVIFHGSKLTSTNIVFTTDIELEINLGSTVEMGLLDSLTIFYQGAPLAGGYGIFRTDIDECPPADSVMWTLSEPYGSKHWWPCKETLNDKADSIDMIITTPAKYRAASNGTQVSETIFGNKKKYHWHHGYPIPAYLVAFAVADYAVYSDTINNPLGGQIEVLNYVYHCDSAVAAVQTPKLDTIMKFFIDSFGQYPYVGEKYGHAQCGFGGGMEHSTMSFMGGFSVRLMAHELAHQWFGDKITCGSWHEIWLNEGFATYLEGLTCEHGIGAQSWSSWLSGKINDVTGNPDGSVYNPDTVTISRIFNSRLSYSKGALLLHMLRWKMGDHAFFSAIRNYISDPALVYGYAHTPDLQNHLEAIYGKSLDEFFADWYFGEGWPQYEVTWAKDASCNNLKVTIHQEHSTGGGTFFEMPVPIAFSDGLQDTLFILHQNSPGDTSFYLDVDFLPTLANFDPDLWLCATHTISEVTFSARSTSWTGATNNDWFDEANWDNGIPDGSTDVHIPDTVPLCVINNSTSAICRTLTLASETNLVVEEGSTLQVICH